MEREIPKEIMDQLNNWKWQAQTLRAIHILLGLTAIIASVTVAARLVNVSSDMMSLIAWLAAVSAAILTSLNLEPKSNNRRNAWRILNTAVGRFKTQPEFTMKELNDAYQTGEEMIGDVTIELSKG